LSHLRKLSDCEQVAAVCYRVRGDGIEFLLVQTRGGGRWTFPKGSTEPGLTHAQAAALEAFEEAGVHGRIEETSFARYVRRRVAGRNSATGRDRELAVNAHLCEVLRLSPPKESNRNRTWFSVQETRTRLRERRETVEAAEFARLVNRAVARIQRLAGGILISEARSAPPQETRPDSLQRVQFEYSRHRREFIETHQLALPAEVSRQIRTVECEVLPFATRPASRNPRLLAASKKVKALGTSARIG
jgi:8-oxo-dGTP pyrophosphatase MutT (NUDIX family)